MSRRAVLTLGAPEPGADSVRFSGTWTEPDGTQQTMWWEVPRAWSDAVTPSADPWLIAFMFLAMRHDRPIHVVGCVSPSLLARLELFMRVWQMWLPDLYRPVAISADRVEELAAPREPDTSIASYSGGLDSNFTIYRHVNKLAGHATRHVGAALLQHGFDIKLDQENSDGIFRSILDDARAALDAFGIPCIAVRTNFRDLDIAWPHAYGTQLVAGLSLFAGRFGSTLVPNDLPYNRLGVRPWATHPITNALLQSDTFRIIDDGGEASRIEKIKAVANWPEALERLRVCYGVAVPGSHENCGHCEKCVRTLVAFRIAGQPKPASFKQDAEPQAIRRVRLESESKVHYWKELQRYAAEAGLDQTDWGRAIAAVLRKQQRRDLRNQLQQPFVPLRDAVRRIVRGTALSKSEQRKLTAVRKS